MPPMKPMMSKNPPPPPPPPAPPKGEGEEMMEGEGSELDTESLDAYAETLSPAEAAYLCKKLMAKQGDAKMTMADFAPEE